ncbi:hypothetical protein PILCRDRAFT_823205, partial [Piloderma croceum F 1598]
MSVLIRSLRSSLRSQPPLVIRQFHSTSHRAEKFLSADVKTFERVVLNTAAKDKVVLVDFYAEHVWNLQWRNGSLTLAL